MVKRTTGRRGKEKELAEEIKELKSLISQSKHNVEVERKRICRDLEDLCKKLCKKHKKSDPPDPPWHYGPRCPHGGGG